MSEPIKKCTEYSPLIIYEKSRNMFLRERQVENEMPCVLYLVVPCYNEKEILAETSKQLKEKFTSLITNKLISEQSRILFVNDGSKDGTWLAIKGLCMSNPLFAGVSLSRNQGHQNAVMAGLMIAKERADAAISLDADLQDDINAIDLMLQKYQKGAQVVYGVRSARATDTFFKRFTAESFYKFMKLMGVDIVSNHADYRLMSKTVLQGLSQFKEVNLFLRGIAPLIGYKSAYVYYERHKRFAGKSKYPLKKMLALAFNGVTSFSVRPIHMITLLGAGIFLISSLTLLWTFLSKLLRSAESVSDSSITSLWVLGGLHIFCLGVVGEYVGKIYSETKARPRYFIEETLIR